MSFRGIVNPLQQNSILTPNVYMLDVFEEASTMLKSHIIFWKMFSGIYPSKSSSSFWSSIPHPHLSLPDSIPF